MPSGRTASIVAAAGRAPGARPLSEAAVDGRRSASEARAMHAVARRGAAGAAGAYPFASRIGEAFGRYAPAGLRAHFGPDARVATQALSADAFVWNGRAVFARRPSLHTAVHEAAHMVGQAWGESLPHAVGARGDAGERLADRVADQVAAGRSAEPVFESALGAAPATSTAPVGLQMNSIDLGKTTQQKFDTPWKQIADQLGVDEQLLRGNIFNVAPSRFGNMMKTLGDNCYRAKTVVADLDGHRTGGPRTNDPMQTAYGAVGSFMAYLTDTPAPTNFDFEGGHLISDEILGDASYVGYNFSPQRGHMNAPVYRKIEELAHHGTEPKSSAVAVSPHPNWSMTVQLDYPTGGDFTVATSQIEKQLSLLPGDITASPAPTSVDLTHWVPLRWHAKVDSSNDDYVFSHEATVDPGTITDPLLRGGAAKGWLATESDVDMRQPEALTHSDANFWAMDSLVEQVLAGTSTQLGTGSLNKRKRAHSYTAVQTVPVGPKPNLSAFTIVLPTPQAVTPFKLATPLDFSKLDDGGLTDTQTLKKARLEAKQILNDNPTWDMTQVALTGAIARHQFAKREFKKKKPPKREDFLRAIRADKNAGKDKRKAAEAFHVISTQILNPGGNSGPWGV